MANKREMRSDEIIPLPPDDPDGELSRRLGQGGDLVEGNAFERALMTYRADARGLEPSRIFSEHLWRKAAPDRMRTLRVIPAWARWAAAAMVLVTFGLWLMWARGPVVEASTGSQILSLTLDDGSSVTLRPRSTLFRLTEVDYRLEGEAFFDVRHDPARVFTVETDLGRVRVLGTRFDISTWGAATAVFLEDGRVEFVFLPSGAIDTLAPGDEVIASSRGLSRRRPHSTLGGSTDWMHGMLVFGERPVSRIMDELEHHFGIMVLVPDSVGNETLSGQIQLTSPEQSLSDIGIALGARFEESRANVFHLAAE